MNTEDMAISEGATSAMANQLVSRIDAVKLVVQDFIKRRTGDRVGLIVFGTNAYLYVPLTFDRATVADMLSGLHSNMAGGRTAIGDAIGLAVKTLQDRAGHTRVVILLTDGASNAGELTPARAAQIAADQHVRVHTIGFGGDTLRLPGFFGFDSRIVNPSADLDEAALTQVAQITGGRFYRARDPQELTKIYAELDQIEPSLQNAPNLRPFTPLHQWPLAIPLIFSEHFQQWF